MEVHPSDLPDSPAAEYARRPDFVCTPGLDALPVGGYLNMGARLGDEERAQVLADVDEFLNDMAEMEHRIRFVRGAARQALRALLVDAAVARTLLRVAEQQRLQIERRKLGSTLGESELSSGPTASSTASLCEGITDDGGFLVIAPAESPEAGL